MPSLHDLRRRVLDAARTLTALEAAARFGVSVATVHRLDRLHGSLEPKPHAGGRALLALAELESGQTDAALVALNRADAALGNARDGGAEFVDAVRGEVSQ